MIWALVFSQAQSFILISSHATLQYEHVSTFKNWYFCFWRTQLNASSVRISRRTEGKDYCEGAVFIQIYTDVAHGAEQTESKVKVKLCDSLSATVALRGQIQCNIRKHQQQRKTLQKHIKHNRNWMKHKGSKKKNLAKKPHNGSVFREQLPKR